MIEVQVLGPLRVRRDGAVVDPGPAGARTVLGILALNGGQPTSRADIVEALWRDRPPRSASNVIQAHIRGLRHALEPGRRAWGPSSVLPRTGDGYALQLPGEQLDLVRFRRLLTEADVRRHDPGQVVGVLGAALGLWHGRPLADVPALTGHKKVQALIEQQRAALARYGDLMIAAGSVHEVIPLLEAAAADEPLDEAALSRLIRAYQHAGRRAEALTTYHEACRRLADELGVDPGRELTAVYAALVDGGRPARSAPAQLPADVRGFTGRATELSELDRLAEGQLCVVSGSAGVGKTALVVRFGHSALERFPGGQLYVDLRGFDSEQPLTAGDALVRLLGALGVTGQDVPADVADRARRLHAELTGKRMLLVLDNARSVDQVRPLLPCPRSCTVVVTSRDTLSGLTAQRVELDTLSRPDALTLLRAVIGARVDAELDAASDLVEQCVRLPLALRVAAELVVDRAATPLSSLVADLTDPGRRLVLLDGGGDQRAAVRQVFSWSYRHLGADAARAFRLLGSHPGLDIDVRAAAALLGTSVFQAMELLEVLGRAHLVTSVRPGRWGMHDLLRAFAVSLGHEDSRRPALNRLFDHYLITATTMAADLGSQVCRDWLDAELPNLTAISAHMTGNGWPRHTVRLATALYRYLDGGRHAEALTIHAQAEQAAQRSGDLSGQAHAVTNLGTVHWQLGRHEHAAEHYRRALELYRSADDQAGAARALTRLGNVEEQMGLYEQAVSHHEQALAHARKAGHRIGEARALTNLGIVAERLGNLDSATDLHRRALSLFHELDDRVGEAVARTRLGIIAMLLGEHEQALTEHGRALDISRDLGHLRGEAHAMINIGDVHRRRGSHDEAIAQYWQALDLCERSGHEYGRATALNGLGDSLRHTGMVAEARRHYAAALEIAVKIGDLDEQTRAHNGLASHQVSTVG